MKKYNVTVNGVTYEVLVEEAGAVSAPVAAAPAAPASGTSNAPENSPNFEGYSNFGGASFFDGNPNF